MPVKNFNPHKTTIHLIERAEGEEYASIILDSCVINQALEIRINDYCRSFNSKSNFQYEMTVKELLELFDFYLEEEKEMKSYKKIPKFSQVMYDAIRRVKPKVEKWPKSSIVDVS